MTARIRLLALLVVFWIPLAAAEGPEEAPEAMEIEAVLVLGPLPLDAALIDDSPKAGEIHRALVMQLAEGPPAAAGSTLSAFGRTLSWQRRAPAGTAGEPGVQVWLVRLEAGRFVEGHLRIEGLESPRLYHGARSVEAADNGYPLALRNGTHTLWIAHRGAVEGETPGLAWQPKADHDRVGAHTEPRLRVSPERLTNAETVSSLAVSPDGRLAALAFDRRAEAADLDLRRLEIRELENNRVLAQWTSARPRALAWSPDGRWLAVQDGDSLWLHAAEDGRSRLVLAKHEKIGPWRWHPDSGSILFAWTEPFEDDNAKARRLGALEDRWTSFRDRTGLYQVDIESGLVRPLAGTERSLSLEDIHPGGRRVLVAEFQVDYSEPPYTVHRLFEIDLESLGQTEIGRYRMFNGARFDLDGEEDGYWLLTGPGFADGATTGEDLIPNEYDTQLYRLSADGKTAASLSRDFDPSLSDIERLEDGSLVLSAVDGERTALVHYRPGAGRFEALEAGVEVIEEFATSGGRRPVVLVRGTDTAAPQRVHALDLRRNRSRVLLDSAPAEYAGVVLGEVRDFAFDNAAGDTIEGRYYLPPDFDPTARYPLIVYYYGGTLPVNRQFTGRYPFHLWAAQGYVIYVLQPRGTVGYGQEFSALHVNAWGEYTADDILEGVEKFVAAHDFVDPGRIGNIGASYGGFMTMYLATLTDRFAASVSHAGISALTSYWGQGWWGFSYSSIASRGSYPWNRPELYVGQSPVYSADRITTPLLLLTGDSDTNVPPGESHNMYTALKLLGREVELVEFPGEDHWILDREQRYVWWDTILAWFDYWLKDEPEWWHHLYPTVP